LSVFNPLIQVDTLDIGRLTLNVEFISFGVVSRQKASFIV